MDRLSLPRAVLEPLPQRVMLSVTASFSAAAKELKVTGDEQDDLITISRDVTGNILVNGGAVPIAGDVPTAANINHLHLVGGAGNDTIVLDETNGPLPGAALFGGAGNDSLVGGSADDFAQGDAGNDTISLGGGEDAFTWNPGDNSDVVDAGPGIDQMIFNGNDLDEQIGILPAGDRLHFTRDVGSVSLDLGGFEMIDFNAFGGADSITVGDAFGTGLGTLTLDLANAAGAGDGSADSVLVQGNDGPNTLNIIDSAAGSAVTGLAANVFVLHADPTLDTLRVNTFGDADTINVSQVGFDGSVRNVLVDAGAGQDTINANNTATDGVARVLPSNGDDAVNVNLDGIGGANVVFHSTQRIGQLDINSGGIAKISPGGGTVLTTTGLGIAGSGKLDLSDNSLIVDYTALSQLGSIRQMLNSGRNGGGWNGPGIVTSAGDASHLGIGYGEAFALFPGGVFAGQPVDATAVVVKFTFYGDANLDGKVDVTDLGRLATNWQLGGKDWSAGDFNYDSLVDVTDLGLLATNWQAGVGNPLSAVSSRSTAGTHSRSRFSTAKSIPVAEMGV